MNHDVCGAPGGANDSNLHMNNSETLLARECVGWIECPHSVLDETTTYKQAKSLMIGHPGSL